MGLAQAISFVVQFANSVVISHYLTPHDLGVFGIATATVAMLSLLQNNGFQPMLVREAEITASLENTTITANAAVAVLLTCLLLASSFIVPGFYHEPQLRPVLVILSVIPLIGIPAFLPSALLEREARFREMAAAMTIAGVFSAATTMVLAVLHFGVVSLAYANVVNAVFFAAIMILFGRRHFRMGVGLSEWRRVFGFGSQIFAASGMITLSPRFGEMLLGRLLGLAALGLYNRANGLCNLIWGGIHPIIARVVLVDFAEVYRKEGSLRERYIVTVAMVTGLFWPGFLGLAVIAKPFIVLVYGQRWEGAAALLSYLCIGSVVLIMSTVAWEVCTVTGQVAVQLRIESIRMVISLLLLAGASLISLEAVAISRIAEAAIAVVLYRPHLNRMTNTVTRDFLPAYCQGAILSIGAVAPALVTTRLLAGQAPLVALLGLGVGAGGLVWLILLFVTGHPLADEIGKSADAYLSKFRRRVAG
jgi:O-antigen/teichoic acid export membrane protein